MRGNPWALEWAADEVPHAVIDVARGCNVTCRACYNSAPPAFKCVDEAASELDGLLARRRLHSLTLLGGEVTLNPELTGIIRLIKARGVHVELFTNGVLLDDRMASDLASAGADLVFVHVERGQRRPDLSEDPSEEAIGRLIDEKVALIARHGMTAGLAFTVYPGEWEAMEAGVRLALEHPEVEYLAVTLYRDMQGLGPVSGNIRDGLFGEPGPPESGLPTMEGVRSVMEGRLHLRPFAYVPSNFDRSEARCLSYLVGCLVRDGEILGYEDVWDSLFERLYIKVHRLLTGRASYFQANGSVRFRLHLILNSLTGGSASRNLRLLRGSLPGRSRLKCLRILFQTPSEILPDGRVVHCRNCPDAVLKGGKLVPVCISDKVAP